MNEPNVIFSTSNPPLVVAPQWSGGSWSAMITCSESPGWGRPAPAPKGDINQLWDRINLLREDGVSQYEIIGMLETIKASLLKD